MLFLMFISLYTSRVILDGLGIEDYGIYNVVGGVVSMFTMISGALNASISRFITYELGAGNLTKLKQTFSASVTIQFILSAILILFAETIGLWFLNNKLVIPSSRMFAANIVYQLSITTLVVNLISVPYNACIIAHEKMSAFAYMSLFDGISKLLVAYFITIATIDHLILYAILLTVISIVNRLVYGWYCNQKFVECHFQLVFNNRILKSMFSFAGWNMVGATSAVLRDHGGNIIINMFFGPSVNSARGVALQVSSAIHGFVSNFQTAMNPQIMKSYAAGDIEYMTKLVYQGAKFSYFILFFLALPVFVNAEYILNIWLVEVPMHSVTFLRLIIIFTLFESLSGPLLTTNYATGIVKKYQIVVGGLQMLNLPLAYICLKIGMIPETIFVVAIVVSFICMVARLIILKPIANISPGFFLGKIFCVTTLVSILSTVPPLFISNYIDTNIYSFVFLCLICVCSSATSIVFVGCTRDEIRILTKMYRKVINRLLYK